MKKLLPFLFLAIALGSCKKESDDLTPNVLPAPSLTGKTWVWTSETTVATNKASGMVTSQSKTVVPNTVTATYGADGKYTAVIDKSITPNGTTNTTTTGTYTYTGGTITYTVNAKTSTARVDVLTNTNLTLVATSEDSNTRYVTTDTYTR